MIGNSVGFNFTGILAIFQIENRNLYLDSKNEPYLIEIFFLSSFPIGVGDTHPKVGFNFAEYQKCTIEYIIK